MTALSRRTALMIGLSAAAAVGMPHVARAATRRLRFGVASVPGSTTHRYAATFARAAAELSGGSVVVDVYPNAQLGDELQMLKAVGDGSLDVTAMTPGPASRHSKEVGLCELPYLFDSVASARLAFDQQLGRHCADLLQAKGFLTLSWGESGLRHFTANKPIRNPADLKGLKLRVPHSEPIRQTFQAMGASVESFSFAQLPEALRIGRFEAQENPINIIVSAGLNRFQSHLSLTGHIYTPLLVLFSPDVMDELSPAQQAALRKAGEAGSAASRDYAEASQRSDMSKLVAAGMTVIEDIDRRALREAAAAAIETLSAEFGAEALRRVRGLVA